MAAGTKLTAVNTDESKDTEEETEERINEEAFDAAVMAASQEEAPKKRFLEEVTLSNGVVIGIRTINTHVLGMAQENVKKPEVPKFYNPDTDKQEENPMHPDYVDAMMRYSSDRSDAVYNAAFLMGTYVKHLPEGFPGPDDDGWIENLQYLKLVDADTLSNKHARYLSWIRFFAIPSDDELVQMLDTVTGKLGVDEGDVQKEIATFPNRSQRRAAPKRKT